MAVSTLPTSEKSEIDCVRPSLGQPSCEAPPEGRGKAVRYGCSSMSQNAPWCSSREFLRGRVAALRLPP
jgi:hypothetical protein